MNIVLLDKNLHDRNQFDCGVDALNNYLKLIANQQAARDSSRTYLLDNERDRKIIVGFYTLTLSRINQTLLPANLQKKHKTVDSVGLIARLAVDRRYTGKGYGEVLLIDALNKLLEASKIVGFPLVIVDAKDGMSQFYLKYGFVPFHNQKNKLFMSLATYRKSLQK